MAIAYIISAYKNLDQLARLIRRLENDQSVVVVHVDKKTDDTDYGRLVTRVSDLRVHFLDRHTCYWGGFAHVRATLKGIDALSRLELPFRHAVLLTGQDYPIKPIDEIHAFLGRNPTASFMSHSALPSPWWSPRGGMDRIDYRHLRPLGRHIRLPGRRTFPAGLKAFGGGAYWCLSRDAIELVAAFVAERHDVVRFFEHVDIPDEIFFHTVVMNSHLAHTVVNDNLRYIDWSRGPRPSVLGTADLAALRRSPKLFARKFDAVADPHVLDVIDRELLGVVELQSG